MLLAVDCGNTQTTVGLIDAGGSVVRQWRMATDVSDTCDALHARLHTYFSMLNLDLHQITDAAISSVVPLLSVEWHCLMHDLLGAEPLMISSSLPCAMPIALKNPAELGADRLANAMGAQDRYGAPVIVVDFGTATNIDVVDAQGHFAGGSIMPGLMLSAQALFSRAAKLSSVPLLAPPHALGTSTETAVQSGLIVGTATMVEGLVGRIKSELAEKTKHPVDAPVIATGGLAQTIAACTTLFDAVDRDLTLHGIYCIWRAMHKAS